MTNTRIVLISALLLAATAGVIYYLNSESAASFPGVVGYGDIAMLPEAAHQPRKGAKVVCDITADAKPGDVNKGLERPAC